MFLIYGWGNRQKPIASGSFSCPVCRTRTDYIHYSQRRWFSLFFIPLFPITSPQEFVGCHQCNNVFSRDSLPMSQGIAPGRTSLSALALVSMLVSFAALITVCVFFISLPLSIAAVIMGHLGYSAVRKNQPYLEGGWQAVTALVVGYTALTISSMIALLFFVGPRFLPDPNNNGTGIGELASGEDGGRFSPERALRAAELMIATKQDLPPGRGNNPDAVRLANNYAEIMKRASDEAFTRSGKPIIQLSGGEYLTYCELHEDRCLFLVHVPSYRNFTDDAKETLVQIAWINAQLIVADELPADSRLGVGLRGTILYGDIIVGRSPPNTEELTDGTSAEKEDLLSFFIEEVPDVDMEPSIPAEPSFPETEPPTLAESSTPDSPSTPVTSVDGPSSSSFTEPTFPNKVGSTEGEEEYSTMEYDNPFESKPTEKKAAGDAGSEESPFGAGSIAIDDSAKAKDIANSDLSGEKSDDDAEMNKSAEDSKAALSFKLLSTLQNDSQAFRSLDFSGDGKWIVGGKEDAAVQLFEVDSGTLLGKVDGLPDAPAIVSVAVSFDNQLLAAGCDSGAFFTWQLDKDGKLQEQQWTRPFKNEIRRTLASPAFGYLMASDTEGVVAWFPFRDAEKKSRKFTGFEREVLTLWLPQQGTEAFATDGKVVAKFSLKDASVIETTDLAVKYPQLAAFSPDGSKLLVADFDNVYLFDAITHAKLATLAIPNREQVHSLQFHPNNKWCALGVKGRTALWEIGTGKLLGQIQSGTDFYDKLVAFSDDGKKLAVASDSEKTPIRIYEIGETSP